MTCHCQHLIMWILCFWQSWDQASQHIRTRSVAVSELLRRRPSIQLLVERGILAPSSLRRVPLRDPSRLSNVAEEHEIVNDPMICPIRTASASAPTNPSLADALRRRNAALQAVARASAVMEAIRVRERQQVTFYNVPLLKKPFVYCF